MNASPDLPAPVRKFNPGTLQSDEEVTRQFVVRQAKLELVLEVLRGNVDSPSCQHVLIVAPRGRGKTMLLARIAAELRAGGTLSERLLPVRFMEESQEIFTLADFWLETLFHLARESRQCNSELARELQEAHNELAAGWRGEDLAERARATVLEASDRLGRKLVLMVENMQALCESVDSDFGWKLRRVLQAEPQIILLATATSRFKGLDDAREPFFELFRILRLEPLDTGECRHLWRAVSGDEADEREIRPLEILTGGNPRLLVIVAGFARHRSLRQLMEQLVTLIDDHTEYFRAHLEGFAKTERRVYLAVIDLWQSSTTGEIAARARMDVRPVSTLLGRLVERGAVVVEGSGRKRRYMAAERLYSIYYRLRRERDEATVVRSLIQFMAVFYTEDELVDMSVALKAEALLWPVLQEGFRRALAETPEVRRAFSAERCRELEELTSGIETPDDEEAERLLEKIQAATDEGEFEQIIEIADQYLTGGSGVSSRPRASIAARMLNAKGVAYAHLDRPDAADAAWEQLIDRFGASDALEIRVSVANASANKGALYGQLGELEAAVAVFDEVVVRFGADDAQELQTVLARTLASKAIALEHLGEHAAAVAACNETVMRFSESDAPEIQGMVATALATKATVLGWLGEVEAAAAVFDEVLERFGTSDAPEVQLPIAQALLSKVVASEPLGDAQAMVTTNEALIKRFDASDSPGLQLAVAIAWVNKASALGRLGKTDDAIMICDQVVERFGAGDSPEVRLLVAMALNCKAGLHLQAGNAAEAVAAWDRISKRFGDCEAPELSTQVALASLNKRLAQGQLGGLGEVMTIYDGAVESFGESVAAQIRLPMASLLSNIGILQEQSGDPNAAIATCEGAIERFGDTDMPELRLATVLFLTHKAKMQAQTGQAEEALRTCDELERRLGTLADNEKAEPRWLMGWIRTRALFHLRQFPDGMDAFRSVYAAFAPGDETMMRRMVAGVIDLVSTGAPERDLLEILSADAERAARLAPLVVALRQRAGEAVRAPPEVLEVAADICKRIEEGADQDAHDRMSRN